MLGQGKRLSMRQITRKWVVDEFHLAGKEKERSGDYGAGAAHDPGLHENTHDDQTDVQEL